MAQSNREQVDREKVAQMRQMLAGQNKEAVQHRFGEQGLNSPEFRQAEKELSRRRSQQQRGAQTDAAEEMDFYEASDRRCAGTVHNPMLVVLEQERERVAAERAAAEQGSSRREQDGQVEQEAGRLVEAEAEQVEVREPEHELAREQVEHQRLESVSERGEGAEHEEADREPTAAERAFSKAAQGRDRALSRDAPSR